MNHTSVAITNGNNIAIPCYSYNFRKRVPILFPFQLQLGIQPGNPALRTNPLMLLLRDIELLWSRLAKPRLGRKDLENYELQLRKWTVVDYNDDMCLLL